MSQANTTISAAIAANKNGTSQTATQNQSGHGTLVQGIGQIAKNKQDALALSDAFQKDATNTNAPVGVFSKGTTVDKYDKYDKKDMNDHKADAGSVSQSNTAAAIGVALNGNSTTQSATQDAGRRGARRSFRPLARGREPSVRARQGRRSSAGVENSNTPITSATTSTSTSASSGKERCEPKHPEPKCDWKKDEVRAEVPASRSSRSSKKDECEPKYPGRAEVRLEEGRVRVQASRRRAEVRLEEGRVRVEEASRAAHVRAADAGLRAVRPLRAAREQELPDEEVGSSSRNHEAMVVGGLRPACGSSAASLTRLVRSTTVERGEIPGRAGGTCPKAA